MPFPGSTFIGELVGRVRDEFEHLYAQFEGWARQEHKEDGSHGDITADSVTTDALTVTSDTTAESTIDGTLEVTGLLSANGGLAVDINRFTVADGTGDTSIGGILDVTGVSTLRGLVNADGGIAVDTSAFTVANATGNTVVGGTLGVTGVATFTDDVDPLTNYVSDLGSLDKKYLTLHAAELWVETLVAADVMATIGGRVVVAPTTTLTVDLGDGIGDTTITVKHNQIANGDRLRLESNGKIEWMAVSSAAGGSAGAYTYSVTRDLDGTGRNVWYAGDAVLNTGTTGDGFIDLYSVSGVLSGAGPTIVGNVRTGTTYSDIAPRWAIGNLKDSGYGHVVDTYGAAFGVPTAAWITIDPTNGIRIGHNVTTKISLDASGNASFTGAVTATSGTFTGTVNATAGYFGDGSTRVAIEAAGINIGNTGSIRGGQTAYKTGTGFWLGYSGAAYKFSIGNTTSYVSWDGSTLDVYAAFMQAGNIVSSGYIAVGDQSTLHFEGGPSGDTYITGSAGADTLYFYCGGQANFRLTSTYAAVPSGTKLYLDSGSDTYLYEVSANRIDIVAGGSVGLFIASDGAGVAAADKVYLDGGGDTYVYEASANFLGLVAGGSVAFWSTGAFYPNTTNTQSCGQSGNVWTAVWATNGTIQTSDLNAKQDITPSDLGLDFILGLKPARFAYTDLPHEPRYGLIAQDVIVAAKGRPLNGIVVGDEGGYGMNYAALVTPLVSAIHTLVARVEALEQRQI